MRSMRWLFMAREVTGRTTTSMSDWRRTGCSEPGPHSRQSLPLVGVLTGRLPEFGTVAKMAHPAHALERGEFPAPFVTNPQSQLHVGQARADQLLRVVAT